MTPKQARFVSEYLTDLNATQAAIRCGYSPKTAKVQGARLLTNADIARAVSEKTQGQLQKADLSAVRVLEEMRRLAFSDVRALFDADGNLKPIHTLNDEEASAIAGIEVIIKNAAAGDGKTDKVHKIKVWDKPKNLELLAKHFALLTDVQRHDGLENLVETLQQRHARNRKNP